MVYDQLKMEDLETEVEKGMTKARYSLMSKPDDNNNNNVEETISENESFIGNEAMEVFNIEKGKLNYNHVKVTEIPTVRRLHPPKPAKIEEETFLLNTKRLLLNTAKEDIDNNCNKKGEPKAKNISAEETEGLREIQEKIKEGSVVVFTTDKSGKFAIDSHENYMEALEEDIKDDIVVQEKEMRESESELNRHSSQLAKSLKIGAAWGHEG
jgi:hypothetical protein